MQVILGLFVILMLVFFLGIYSNSDEANKKNYTHAFCSLVIAIALICFGIM